MSNQPQSTPAQLAALKLLVPQIAERINALQLDILASNLDFLLSPEVTVRQQLQQLVLDGCATEEDLVDIVRTVRITQLRPGMLAARDQAIAQHGYAIQQVFASEETPAFAYTVGLTGTVGFELLALAGQDPALLSHVVRQYAELAKSHERIEIERNDLAAMATRPNFGVRTKCVPIEVRVAEQNFMVQSLGELKRVYQVLIADKNNLLPGEQGYDRSWSQPRLPRPL